MSIFDEGTTIPAPSESPDNTGHEEETAVTSENQETAEQEESEEQETEETTGEEQETGSSEEDALPDESGNGDPQLLAGKYKTQDDLVRGYLELQRKLGERVQQVPGQPPVVPQQPGQSPGQPQPTEELREKFFTLLNDDPIGTMRYLIQGVVNEQVAPIHEQRSNEVLAKNIDTVAKDFKQIRSDEGMTQLFGKVNEIAQELGNPEIARNPSPRVLRMAAVEAFGQSTAQIYRQGKETARQEAEAARRNKQGLPTTSTKPKETNEQPLSEEDQVRQGIVAAGRGRKGLFG